MEKKETEIPQLKVKETPANCPVPPPCPVCPPEPKPTQVLLKVLLVLGAALVLAVIILVGSGLRITRKESLLDIWLASRRGITPTPEVLTTPTPDLTDWKTYTNERYGYSLKYPKSWFLNEASTAGFGGIDVLYSYEPPKQVSKDPNFWQGKLKIDIGKILQEKKENQDLEGWLTEYEKQLGSELSQEIAREKINLAGREALKQTRKYTGSEKLLVNYFISNGNYVYFVSVNGDFNPKNSELLNQTLSTFKFLDKESGTTSEEARLISFEKIADWLDYSSPTGYSIQHPSSFQATAEGEEKRDGTCYKYFSNNAGGTLIAKVVPYDGGSRRQLYGTESGYTYKYEEAVIQGQKSLLVEKGPIGDSGSGSGVVVPVGNKALILSWSNRAKDNPEFINLLKSIKLGESLDLTKCQTL